MNAKFVSNAKERKNLPKVQKAVKVGDDSISNLWDRGHAPASAKALERVADSGAVLRGMSEVLLPLQNRPMVSLPLTIYLQRRERTIQNIPRLFWCTNKGLVFVFVLTNAGIGKFQIHLFSF